MSLNFDNPHDGNGNGRHSSRHFDPHWRYGITDKNFSGKKVKIEAAFLKCRLYFYRKSPFFYVDMVY